MVETAIYDDWYTFLSAPSSIFGVETHPKDEEVVETLEKPLCGDIGSAIQLPEKQIVLPLFNVSIPFPFASRLS